MLDSPGATPVEQPEGEAGRPWYGDEQRMQRERSAENRRGEPAAAFRYEPMTNRHKRGQQSQPADEHEQASDRQFARPVRPPANARDAAEPPLSYVPHALSSWPALCGILCPSGSLLPVDRAGPAEHLPGGAGRHLTATV